MTTAQTTFEAELAELVESSFATFCQETGAMFGWEMESEQREVCIETVKGLKKRFKKVCAAYAVQSDGVLNGRFQLIFDHKGLFTVGGMIVMLPENRIIENRKLGTVKEADEISDAVKEAGNMLIGSLDKVFRGDLEGHGHLLHTNTFIGEPWDKPDENLGLGIDEEFLYIACEMKIESYPAFQCGVIFPKRVYDHEEKSSAGQPVAAEPKPQVEAEQQSQAAKTKDDRSEPEERSEERNETEKPIADTIVHPEENVPATKEEQPAQTVGSGVKQELSNTENDDSVPEEKAELKSESEESVAEAMSSSVENASVIKDEQFARAVNSDVKKEPPNNVTESFPCLCARDIMRRNVLWCSSEEAVGKVLAKMCQNDINFALVGSQGMPEGIVSMSDLRAGMSPYLRPEFAKWRRPIDDASLRIKVRWLMSKKIHTVKSRDRLSEVAVTMCRLGLRSMPVVAQDGQIEGIISVFDVLRTLLHSDKDIMSNI